MTRSQTSLSFCLLSPVCGSTSPGGRGGPRPGTAGSGGQSQAPNREKNGPGHEEGQTEPSAHIHAGPVCLTFL